MDRIAPWVHYVPIQLDLSDLYDALAFFRGDGNGDGAHEDLARNIAKAGRQWSKTFWRREDLVAYFFRFVFRFSCPCLIAHSVNKVNLGIFSTHEFRQKSHVLLGGGCLTTQCVRCILGYESIHNSE